MRDKRGKDVVVEAQAAEATASALPAKVAVEERLTDIEKVLREITPIQTQLAVLQTETKKGVYIAIGLAILGIVVTITIAALDVYLTAIVALVGIIVAVAVLYHFNVI